MKLQLDFPLIEIVRKPRKHLVPQSLALQIPLYIALFIAMMIVETIGTMPMISDVLDEWHSMHYDVTKMTFQEVGHEMMILLKAYNRIGVVLLCTGFGTIMVLLYCRYIECRKFRTMGFRKQGAVFQYLMGIAAGILAFSAVVGIALLCGGLQFNGYVGQFTGSLLVVFLGFLVQGMSEEVLFRGMMMTSTLRHHNLWWAIGINSVLFGSCHCLNDGFSAFAMLNLVLYSVMISLYVLRTDNLWGACAFHSIWNFAQGNFYGLPVSGIDSGDTILSMSLNGSSIANGGEFGLEASIGCTIVMSVMIVGLLFIPNPFAKKNPQKEEAAA